MMHSNRTKYMLMLHSPPLPTQGRLSANTLHCMALCALHVGAERAVHAEGSLSVEALVVRASIAKHGQHPFLAAAQGVGKALAEAQQAQHAQHDTPSPAHGGDVTMASAEVPAEAHASRPAADAGPAGQPLESMAKGRPRDMSAAEKAQTAFLVAVARSRSGSFEGMQGASGASPADEGARSADDVREQQQLSSDDAVQPMDVEGPEQQGSEPVACTDVTEGQTGPGTGTNQLTAPLSSALMAMFEALAVDVRVANRARRIAVRYRQDAALGMELQAVWEAREQGSISFPAVQDEDWQPIPLGLRTEARGVVRQLPGEWWDAFPTQRRARRA